MYDLVILTHLPAFYKVNLYNELSKSLNIHVIFLGDDTSETRSTGFADLGTIHFDYTILHHGNFQTRHKLSMIFKIHKLLKKMTYKKILVGGWELLESWYIIFTNPYKTNAYALESTINESTTNGLKGYFKRLFLSRVATVYASGSLHKQLLLKLHYHGEIKITQGVGIINKPFKKNISKKYRNKFLFIGRLVPEKNLHQLINLFNSLPDYQLSIVGNGPEFNTLQNIANDNIKFYGAIRNESLPDIFNNHNLFILPSISETWGLVLEEALYFGLPVIVSKNCGASELITHGTNGYVFDTNDFNSLLTIICNINDKKYQELVSNVRSYSLDKKDTLQVNIYIDQHTDQ